MSWSITVPATAQTFTPVVAAQDLTWTRPLPVSRFRVIGRRNEVARVGTRSGMSGSLPVVCETDAEYAELQTALANGYPITVSAPWGLVGTFVVGDTSEVWRAVTSVGPDVYRVVTLPLVEVDSE